MNKIRQHTQSTQCKDQVGNHQSNSRERWLEAKVGQKTISPEILTIKANILKDTKPHIHVPYNKYSLDVSLSIPLFQNLE